MMRFSFSSCLLVLDNKRFKFISLGQRNPRSADAKYYWIMPPSQGRNSRGDGGTWPPPTFWSGGDIIWSVPPHFWSFGATRFHEQAAQFLVEWDLLDCCAGVIEQNCRNGVGNLNLSGPFAFLCIWHLLVSTNNTHRLWLSWNEVWR